MVLILQTNLRFATTKNNKEKKNLTNVTSHKNKTQGYLTVTNAETMTALRILNTKVLFTYVTCTNISAKVSNWYSVIIANFASNYKKVP